MKDFGEANSWKETPAPILKCFNKGHMMKMKKISRCYCSYTCDKCGITYKVDSGG